MNYVEQAAHLMWLQRRLIAHRRWLRWLFTAWVVSIIAAGILFTVALPLLQDTLRLPSEVVGVTVGGIAVEFLALLYLTIRVVIRYRSLEAQINQITVQ
jgi:hypothetical protein